MKLRKFQKLKFVLFYVPLLGAQYRLRGQSNFQVSGTRKGKTRSKEERGWEGDSEGREWAREGWREGWRERRREGGKDGTK